FLLGAEAPTRSLQGESDSAPWVSLTGPSSILARRSCTPSSATTTTSTVAAPPGQSSNLALVLAAAPPAPRRFSGRRLRLLSSTTAHSTTCITREQGQRDIYTFAGIIPLVPLRVCFKL